MFPFVTIKQTRILNAWFRYPEFLSIYVGHCHSLFCLVYMTHRVTQEDSIWKYRQKDFFWTYENRLIRERIYSHTHLCPIFRQFFGWFVASRQQTFFPKILPLTVYIVIYIHFKHLFRICIFSAMLATVMLSLIYFVFTATQIIQNFSTWHYLHVCIKKSTKTLYCFNAKRWNRK